MIFLMLVVCSISYASLQRDGNFTESVEAELAKIPKSQVLDEKNSLPTEAVEWERYTEIFWGGILFVAGFAAGKIWLARPRRRRRIVSTSDPLIIRLGTAEDPKALLQLLIAHDEGRLTPYIERIEEALYGEASLDLEWIKSQIIEELSNVS